jgi:hypothetical protein
MGGGNPSPAPVETPPVAEVIKPEPKFAATPANIRKASKNKRGRGQMVARAGQGTGIYIPS